MEWIQNLWADWVVWVEAYPWLLWLAIALLGGLGFPVSPLLVLCGVIWGKFLPMAWVVACGMSALMVAAIWNWALFRLLPAAWVKRWLRIDLEAWRGKYNSKTERVWLVCLVLRFTPGLPFIAQNGIMGAMQTPFVPYTVAALLGTGVTGGAIISMGSSVARGNWSGLALGLILLLLVTGIGRTMASRGVGG